MMRAAPDMPAPPRCMARRRTRRGSAPAAGLDRVPAARECRQPRRDRAMGAVIGPLPDQMAALPRPADPRLCELGFAAWDTALAEAADKTRRRARPRLERQPRPAGACWPRCSATARFSASSRSREWAFLTRLVEAGPDPLFDDIAARLQKTRAIAAKIGRR